jgi:2-polyprenyl-6-methoxyphenol hydroxylase-like FAD-dependent oxidoreductase
VERGGTLGDVQSSIRWYQDGYRLRDATCGHDAICVSRPTLEGCVRERVRALGNVRILDGCPVRGLVTTSDHSRVTGVQVPGLSGNEAALHADLVVDATGRGSHGPQWLEGLGYEPPIEDAVHVGIGYATRVYRRRPGELDGDMVVVVAACVPDGRMGVALAAEDDRWVVTLGGYADDKPPTDPDAWLDFARSLRRSDIAELVERAEPLDDPVPFRYPASTRRRYERLRRFPSGYLAFGDALCSFNPIYGQGMTVAALEALALHECLDRDATPLHRAFFDRASRLIDVPWDIAVGTDLRFDHVVGPRTAKVRFVNRYLARLYRAAQDDAVVATAFLRVVNLFDRPEHLLSPRIALRVLLRGRGRVTAPLDEQVLAADVPEEIPTCL